MSTHSIQSRLHTHAIYLIVSFLGGLLISLQLVLPATTFAASPQISSAGYTFGKSLPMDLASVSVVRLIVTTNPTEQSKSSTCNTGLGTIVSSTSNPASGSGLQPGRFLNTVLTDGSLLTCPDTVTSLSIVIYPDAAYTNSAANTSPLATITCDSTLKTCDASSSASSPDKQSTTCQNAVTCTKGVILLPFVTANQQPYLSRSVLSTPVPATFHIELGTSSGTRDTPLSNPQGNLIPFSTDQQTQASGNSATPTPSPAQAFEPGTPAVNASGQLVSIYTSTGDTRLASLKSFPIPLSPANQLQATWAKEVSDFYSGNYATVVNSDVLSAGNLNPTFAAATALKTVASNKVSQNTTPTNTNRSPKQPAQQTSIINNLSVLLAIAGLIFVILLLLLVSLILGRRRRGLAQFEKEHEAASRTAELEAQRIRMEEAAQRVAEPVPGQQGQAGYPAPSPFSLPVPVQGMPAGSQQGQLDLRCPNCGYPFTKGDAFCSNCRAVLAPSESGYHVRMVQPPPPPQSPPVQQSPVLMPPPSMSEMPTLQMSPGQQSLAEETTAPGPNRMPYFNGHNINIVAGSRSDPGIKRKQKPNEDSLLAVMGERTHNSLPQQFGLFVVADGMGGHTNGQDASRLAIQTIVDRILPRLSSSEDLDEQALVQLLVQGVQQANMAVYERNLEHHADMGTTMTSAIVVGNMAFVANVGDSRTYMYREPEGLHKITHDHSVVASLVEAGIIRNEDIYTHPKRNQIYRSLGEKPDLEVDSFVEPLQPGDKLLLCSDGLWEMVHDHDPQRDKDIQRIMSISNADPKQTVNALINAANEGGGEDNISVIVVSVTEATARTGMTGFHLLEKPETVQMPRM